MNIDEDEIMNKKTRKDKILIIDVNYKSSSTGKIVYDLHSNLLLDGYSSFVCYGRGKRPDEPNVIRFSSKLEVYIHAFLSRITGLMGYFSFISTRKLLKFIEMYKPDVVHIHELHAYFVNIIPVIEYLKKNNIRTVWTFHCEYMYTGNCGHAFDCNNWMGECGNCPNIRNYPKSLFFDFTRKMFLDKKRAFEGFDNLTIVTPSKWLAGRVQQSFLKDKKLMTIYNGIDTKVFYPRDDRELRKKHSLTTEKILLAVAPNLLSEEKGGNYILKIAGRMENDNVKFILIGVDGTVEKCDDNVIILGRINDQDELAKYYSLADSLLICSKKETFPTVCLESLACGTPIYGFDTGGVKETAPGGLGIFVEYGDVEGLVDAIRANEFCEDISSKCAEYAKNHYSKDIMYQKYKELYLQSN